ncbi:MAG: DUF6076 domain-containing protein [Eubacterium sp.]
MNPINYFMLEPARLYVHNGKEIELYYYEETKDGCFERNYESTVNDEIFKMIEADLSFISRGRKRLSKIYNKVKQNNADYFTYRQFFVEAKKIVNDIKKYSQPISAILLCLIQRLEEQTQGQINIDDMDKIWYEIETVIYMQFNFKKDLTHLSYIQLINENRKVVAMYDRDLNLNLQTIFEYKDKASKEYLLLDSIADYYNALFYNYVISNPMIAQCKYCDKYFVPKTKKVTLYCDRVNSKGKTCKVLGAKLTYHKNIKSDPVLDLYHKEKHRIEMYCTRSKLDSYDFFYDYYNWVEMFEPKVAEYKNGNYDGDKLIAEIKGQTPNYQPYSKGKYFADEEGY